MKKTIQLHLVLFLIPSFMFGQWTQLGPSIQAETIDNLFGHSTSINADGNVMVAGAYRNDDGGYNAGHVRVFDWDGIDWAQRGSDINGGSDEWSGFRAVSYTHLTLPTTPYV